MAGIESRNMDDPDEVRSPDKTTVNVVGIAGHKIGRYTFKPGWKWSECVKPVAGTDTCQVDHIGYALSGRLHVVHDDGTAVDISEGEAYRIAPGHDAWVIGDDEFVGIEFQGAERYAKG